jgi:hypothetical protein
MIKALYHISLFHANLNDIHGPNFSQVFYHHFRNVSCVVDPHIGINSFHEFFDGQRDTYHTKNRMVGDQIQPLPANVAPYVCMNILIFFATRNFILFSMLMKNLLWYDWGR